jgi:hypothetical protein
VTLTVGLEDPDAPETYCKAASAVFTFATLPVNEIFSKEANVFAPEVYP